MSGTISATLTSTYYMAVSPTTILGTGAVVVDGVNAVAGGPDSTLINYGHVRNNFSNGVSLGACGTVTNAASGTITTTFNYAVVVSGGDGTVTNSGSIGGGFAGVDITGGGVIANQANGAITTGFGGGRAIQGQAGPVAVTNAGNVYGKGGAGIGIALYGGGGITNLSGGLIAE
jgi:hypothetical protein